jgi:hypothetical protein
MTDYSNTFGGAAKDGAASIILGADHDTQYDAIATASASKANTVKVEATGDTAAGDNSAMGYTATEGLVLTGQGSTNDVTIKNDVDGTVATIPTGTTIVKLEGGLLLTERADHEATPATGFGEIWMDSDDSPPTLKYTDEAATDFVLSRGPILETSVATTSGTAVDFTSIPSWVTKITVMIDGVSTDGIGELVVQIGDSGGIETTGYISRNAATLDGGTTMSVDATTASFFLNVVSFQEEKYYGVATLHRFNSASLIWHLKSMLTDDDAAANRVYWGAGRKTLSAVLDRVRFTSTGADTFDAGAVNIRYD